MFRIHHHVALPLATVVCVGLLACSSSDDSTTDTPTAKPSASSSGSPQVTAIHISSPPTPTVAATPVGTDNGLCSATASVSIPAPPGPNYTESVTGVLTCANGIDPAGAIMHTVWHEKSAGKTCDATADATGTASCSRKIGMLTPGFKVVIDVTFGLNGAAYATTASFTPQCCTPS